MHEENDQGEVTSNRDNVHKKTSSSSAHKDVVERTPMKTILLPVCNETKGLRNVECSYKIIGERSDTKIQHNNGALLPYVFNINFLESRNKIHTA